MFIINCRIWKEKLRPKDSGRGNHRFNRWFFFALDSGLFVTLNLGMSLVTTLIFSKTLTYACFYFIVGRLYIASLLSHLNTRPRERCIYGSSAQTGSRSRSRPASRAVAQASVSVDSIQIYFDRTKHTVTSEEDLQLSEAIKRAKRVGAKRGPRPGKPHDEPFANASSV
ncbi:hypothetical protein PM082_007396 [Marasmius tenuissimus]|nr:hypothetical protein PM082_007396 [Marasmius tenuissimus]